MSNSRPVDGDGSTSNQSEPTASTDPETPNTDSPMADSEPATPDTESTKSGRRDVVVPMRLYKTITVFSTLIAALSILIGFILLDAATLEVSVLRGVIVAAIGVVGITPDQSLLSGLLGVVGLSLMALGSGVFILSSRFRADGMGNAQVDSDEESTNG